MNPFETNTKGRHFVVDVSINWATGKKWQTEVLDAWKVTHLNILCQNFSVSVPATCTMYNLRNTTYIMGRGKGGRGEPGGGVKGREGGGNLRSKDRSVCHSADHLK